MSQSRTLLLSACATLALAASGASAQTVATIDGSKITESQLNVYAMGRTGAPPTDANRAELIGQLGDLVVLSNVAVKNKLAESDEVKAELELQRRSVLAQAVIKDYVAKNQISDEQLRAEYDRQIKEFPAPAQYKARHILVETEDDAKAVIKQLDGGADFAELAMEKSTGPSGPKGGDLGWFDASSMVAPFSEAVVAMENGKYSEAPVKTQFGWHVILREDTRQAEPPAFEELKDRLRQNMEQQKFQDYFNALKASAKLEIK